ncbi:unnamed protein product [Mytilus coruscus]|uniref:Uncharacterized protein n=1 Tax=Mytilus coruscus TaxID=42192 RepID=A0A6J8EV89_MYTCO|nr:unnamed protein product [Mytilus coruscus]
MTAPMWLLNKDDDDTLCSDTYTDNSADVDQIQTDTVHDDDDLDSMTVENISDNDETITVGGNDNNNKMSNIFEKGGMNKTKSQSQPSPREPSLDKTVEITGLENEGESFEAEMTDEELAVNMVKVRRKRLVTAPKFSSDELKKIRRDPRNKLTARSSSQN